MKALLSAIQFLTIFPVGAKHRDERLAFSVAFFPMVGLLIGIVLAGANILFVYLNFNTILLNVSVVIILVIITGAIHLDGLADTFDALLSGKGRNEMLAIMRDPHIGSMGTVSIVIVLLMKIALLYSIDPMHKTQAILLMTVLSRWIFVIPIATFPYARAEGKALIFTKGPVIQEFVIAAVSAFVMACVISKFVGLVCFSIVSISAYLMNLFIKHKLGGYTGDTIGASGELAELITLSVVLIMGASV